MGSKTLSTKRKKRWIVVGLVKHREERRKKKLNAAISAWTQDGPSTSTSGMLGSDFTASTSGRNCIETAIKEEGVKEELILEDYGNPDDAMELQPTEEVEGKAVGDAGVAFPPPSLSGGVPGTFETIICGGTDIKIKQEIFEDESDYFRNSHAAEATITSSSQAFTESPELFSTVIPQSASTTSSDSLNLLSKMTNEVQPGLNKSLEKVMVVKSSDKLLEAAPGLSFEKCQICVNQFFSSHSDLVKHCILKHSDSDVSAKDHLSEAEMAPNLESEAEGKMHLMKRPRIDKVIVLPDEEWTSSDDEDVGCRGKKPPKPKISPFLPPPSLVSPKTSSVFRPSTPNTPAPCSPVTTLSQPLAIDMATQSSSSSACSGHSNELLQIKVNQEQMWKVLGELSKTSERLEKKMDKILSILEQPSQPKEAPETPCEERLLALLPVKVDKLDELEEKLKEPAIKHRLMNYLLAVGGRDVKAMAANVMRRVFVDEIGEQYSLTGKTIKDGPEKKPFVKMESFRLVYDVCLWKFPDAEENQIRGAVSDWLMQAKFRKLRRENRRGIKSIRRAPVIHRDIKPENLNAELAEQMN